MYCPKCGAQNNDKDLKCAQCGQFLHCVQTEDAFSSLVPYRNAPALIAYYLAIFSLIPCIGLFLGIAAFFLGLKGLKISKATPELKGKVHAWVGILLGGFFGLLYLILTVLFFVAVAAARK
ncbi:MAG: hypothetical protein NT060_05485 [Candidatus Omnitrophica bacterium]|nr:hypothetical protein [Candidatus Omnitrophota bacterium]